MPVTIVGNNTPTAGGVVYGDGTNYASTSAGSAGQVLQSNGSSAPSWITPSSGAMVLLANLTPTAAANVDALTTFSATYDNYLILLQGIQTADATGTCTLNMRYAVAGTADANTRYTAATTGSSIGGRSFGATNTNILMGLGTLDVTGPGLNASIFIQNANATNSSFKTAFITTFNNNTATPSTIDFGTGMGAYNGTSALSGVRFYLNNGANFAAQGRVRIYGIVNS